MTMLIRKRAPQNPGNTGAPDKRARAIFDKHPGSDIPGASNPFQNGGRITKRNVGGVTRTIGLNTTACLVAIDQGCDRLIAMASAYGLKIETLAKTIREMEQDDLIEARTGLDGVKPNSQAGKTFGLTSHGKDLMDEMECSGDVFYSRCRAFLDAKGKAQDTELEKAEGKDF